MPKEPMSGSVSFAANGSAVKVIGVMSHITWTCNFENGKVVASTSDQPTRGEWQYTDDGQGLLIRQKNGDFQFENRVTGAVVDLPSPEESLRHLAFQHVWSLGDVVLVRLAGNELIAWDLNASQVVSRRAEHRRLWRLPAEPVSVGGDMKRAAVVSSEEVVVLNLPDLSIGARIHGHFTSGVISETGRYVLVLEGSEVVRYEIAMAAVEGEAPRDSKVGNVVSDGTLGLNVKSGHGITDLAGNALSTTVSGPGVFD